MRTKVNYSTIEIYWKEGGDVYKMFTKEREEDIYYHYNTTKNGMHHSLYGEHSIYTSYYGGGERYEAYHKDGILHNLYGYAEYTYDIGDDYRDINYYIEGQIIGVYNTYKQRVIEYKQNKKQEVKNALLENTNICNDVSVLISEYVI